MAKKLGEVIIERDWLEGKLESLDLSIRKEMVDSEGIQAKSQNPSLNRQLQLLRAPLKTLYTDSFMRFFTDEANFRRTTCK